MQIKVTREIPREILENIFITALEGGSNYWYFLDRDAIDIIEKFIPYRKGNCISETIFKAVMDHGCELPIRDADDASEIIGTLSARTMQERLQALSENEHYSWAIEAELSEEGDACSSDIMFQAMCLGEVIYS